MNPTFIQNPDGTYSQQTTVPFDPIATQSQIDDLKAQQTAAVELATNNAMAQFQPQIDALQAMLDAATAQVPAIATALQPASPAQPAPAQTVAQPAQQS